MQINWKIVGVIAVILVVGVLILPPRQDIIVETDAHYCLKFTGPVNFESKSLSSNGVVCTFELVSPERDGSVIYYSFQGPFTVSNKLLEKNSECALVKKQVADQPGREDDAFYSDDKGNVYLCNKY